MIKLMISQRCSNVSPSTYSPLEVDDAEQISTENFGI